MYRLEAIGICLYLSSLAFAYYVVVEWHKQVKVLKITIFCNGSSICIVVYLMSSIDAVNKVIVFDIYRCLIGPGVIQHIDNKKPI